jgi:hypothetical protein
VRVIDEQCAAVEVTEVHTYQRRLDLSLLLLERAAAYLLRIVMKIAPEYR